MTRRRSAGALPLLLALIPRPALSAEDFAGSSFYIGDPHSHTGISGDGRSSDISPGCVGCGALAAVFDYADLQALDWVAFSDHSNDIDGLNISDQAAYDAFQPVVLAHDDAAGLIVVPSAEVWFTIGGVYVGHKNLLLFGDDTALAAYHMADAQPAGSTAEIADCSVIATWMDTVTAAYGHALIIPHHPYGALPAATDWSCFTPEYEPGVEVYSHWGNGLGWSRDWETAEDPQPGSSVHAALDPDGYSLHLGFLAGTDDHDTLPGEVCMHDRERDYAGGLTMVVTDESEPFSREAIYSAILEHRTYASTGPHVPMIVEYVADEALIGTLGQDIELPAGLPVVVRVTLPEADALNVLEAVLIAPDQEIPLDYVADGMFEAVLDPSDLPAWVYAAVNLDGLPYEDRASCDDGGDDTEWLWASPTWFTQVDADDDADSYSLAEGDCDDGDPLTNPGAAEVYYDGADQNCDGHDDYDQDRDGYRSFDHGGSDCNDTDPAVTRPPQGHRVPADCD